MTSPYECYSIVSRALRAFQVSSKKELFVKQIQSIRNEVLLKRNQNSSVQKNLTSDVKGREGMRQELSALRDFGWVIPQRSAAEYLGLRTTRRFTLRSRKERASKRLGLLKRIGFDDGNSGRVVAALHYHRIIPWSQGLD